MGNNFCENSEKGGLAMTSDVCIHAGTAGTAGILKKKKEVPCRYVTEGELAGVASYMKGRLTVEKVGGDSPLVGVCSPVHFFPFRSTQCDADDRRVSYYASHVSPFNDCSKGASA